MVKMPGSYPTGTINFDEALYVSNIPAGSYIKSVQYSEKNQLVFIGTESKGTDRYPAKAGFNHGAEMTCIQKTGIPTIHR